MDENGGKNEMEAVGRGALAAEETREEILAALGRLEEKWLEKALNGEVVAAQLLLEIEKQRAALLGLGVSASGVRIAAGAAAGNGGGEVKVVVEYVQDWREARRQRGEG